jgi:hypothetical protein
MKWKKVWQNFYFYIYALFDRKIVFEQVTLKFINTPVTEKEFIGVTKALFYCINFKSSVNVLEAW